MSIQTDAAFDLLSTLDLVREGIVISDRAAGVLYANYAASMIFDLRDGLELNRGLLTAAIPSETKKIRQLCESCSNASGGALLVSRPSLKDPYQVIVLPAGVFDRLPGATAMVTIVDPLRPIILDPTFIRQLFGLTETEARVASAVADGDNVPEAARALGVSRNTVRTHLQRAFDKLGVQSQAQLVRRLMTLPSQTLQRSAPGAFAKAPRAGPGATIRAGF